ncbi:MAG TPA: autotransporter domain-containing protein [Xanthobacteraceae bacterium]|nr:autotransporter domain-containing protein [Xanthobacteraceae bacterium]
MTLQGPGARARRLSCLLAGTALVSVAALSMSDTDALAQCAVTVGAVNNVDCFVSPVTTTNTTNLNGANIASDNRIQEFNNGLNTTGNVSSGRLINGFGLQLSLTGGANNTLTFTNSGTVTTNQSVNALELNGNGGLVTYTGSGTVSTTAGAGSAMVVTNTGAGGVTVTNNGSFSSVNNYGLFIETNAGPINVNGSGSISGAGGINVAVDTPGDINITGSGTITGTTLYGVYAETAGGNVQVATTNTISGGNNGIDARTGGTGTMTVTTGGAVTSTSGIGIVTSAFNGTTTINVAHNLNGTTGAVFASTAGSGAVNVSLTAGTVGTVSGDVVSTAATTGTTTITTNVNLTSSANDGIDAGSTTGTINVNGSGAVQGNTIGVQAQASGAGNINITGSGAIVGVNGTGVFAGSNGGNVLVATTNTISGNNFGISAATGLTGTVTVTTGGAVGGTAGTGIRTAGVNGTTTVNVAHNVTGGGGTGISSVGNGSGTIDINHTGGIIAATTIGINATQSGTGTIDISQTGGALNGTTGAVLAQMTGGGNVIVSLTGGTIGNTSGNTIETTATTGTTAITTNVALTSTAGFGVFAQSTTGTINVDGSGAVQGAIGILANASGAGNINITGTGAVTSSFSGVQVSSAGGNVLVATGSTISGIFGIVGSVAGTGTLTITTGGAVTGTTQYGITTQAEDGAITVNVGHNVTGGSDGIRAIGGGLIDINHTAGTIASGAIGIGVIQSSTGAIDINQTGGALNGTTQAVLANGSGGTGNVIVSLTGGTVGNVSGNAIETSASTGSTTITTGVAITSTAANAINATATSGNIGIANSSTVNGATNAVFGSTSGTFNITNSGTLNGNVNVTGSNVVTSTFGNSGTWNAGTGSSQFSGNLNNTGTVNLQNGAAGQIIALGGNYAGNGAYRIDVAGGGSTDRINVTGAATLTGGTVNVAALAGAAGSYTILHADGGLGGTQFAGLSGAPANFLASLSYTPTDVLLSLAAFLGAGTNLNQNQQNVAAPINAFLNGGGVLPPGFGALFGLTGQPLANALTQLSGEHATGIQPASNLSTGMFLNAMLDPFVTGRTGGFGQAMGYTQETPSQVAVAAREAFAADMPVKAPVPYIAEQRWSVWGSAYGGRNRTDGDATVGSNDLSATAAGFAAGADYRVSPGSVIGMAVAIGETRWNVSGVGKGDADVAQIGGYASTRWDALYVSGAVALAWHRASTDRTVTIAGTDRLEADFNATSFGGRLEGGYRYGSVNLGLTPYAAVQVTGIHTSSYNEVATSGSNQFALAYTAQSANDIRSELGFWADTRHAFGNGALVTLRGRAAWVHDYNPGSRIQAAFQTLPGTSFVVDGAAAPRDAALTSAVAELRFTNGVTLIGKFDGEFASGSHTLAGTGTLKYAW